MVAEAHRSCVRQYGKKETIFGPTHSLSLSAVGIGPHTKSFFLETLLFVVLRKRWWFCLPKASLCACFFLNAGV